MCCEVRPRTFLRCASFSPISVHVTLFSLLSSVLCELCCLVLRRGVYLDDWGGRVPTCGTLLLSSSSDVRLLCLIHGFLGAV